MKTTINKIFVVEEPIERVWEYLSDPTKIVSCVPGASLTEKIDDQNFKGKVSLKLGPVKAKFDGAITIEELNLRNRSMVLKGKGTDPKGKGSADLLMNGVLTEKNGKTEVNYTMDVSIVGTLAQFGARLIDDVTDQILNQFISNFKSKLKTETPAILAPPGVGKKEVAPAMEPTKKTTENAAEKKTAKTEPVATTANATEDDNSLNALTILWAVIKGFFGRLFGGGKK